MTVGARTLLGALEKSATITDIVYLASRGVVTCELLFHGYLQIADAALRGAHGFGMFVRNANIGITPDENR